MSLPASMEGLLSENGWQHVDGKWVHFCVTCGCVSSGMQCNACYGRQPQKSETEICHRKEVEAINRVQSAGPATLLASATVLAETLTSVKRRKDGEIDGRSFPRHGQRLKHCPMKEQKYRIARGLFDGLSVREICAKAGCSRQTVTSFRRTLEKLFKHPILCACGKPSTHRGMCAVRLKRHPIRQQWLRDNWHNKAAVAA